MLYAPSPNSSLPSVGQSWVRPLPLGVLERARSKSLEFLALFVADALQLAMARLPRYGQLNHVALWYGCDFCCR